MSSPWQAQLSSAGYRLTDARQAVIQIMQDATTPLGPQDILAQGQALHAELGLVTVYRTVSLLTELGLLRRIHRKDGCHAYLPASPGHHHVVVCTCCGCAVEFEGQDDMAALVRRVEEHTGFCIQEHLLQLTGLCPGCQHHNSDSQE